ncbi:MAG: hypothetical protein KC636_06300 [Myxococcales bacterium]|nr:hypothetical protein [Myxococcales bacterium]
MRSTLLALPLLLIPLTSCTKEADVPLAEKAEKLEVEKPADAGVATYTIQGADAKVGFSMDAPFEKIRGKVPGAAIGGTIYADLDDLAKSTALIHVDLSALELFQQAKGDDGEFGEEKKEDLQNEHARAWLEISPDTPEDVRKKNERVEFSIKSVTNASTPAIAKMDGATRSVTFTATGEFLLHQRKAEKSAEIEATFHFEGDKPTKLTVKTVKPLLVGLDEYDVRPREGFGKLAAKALADLAPKVAKEAAIELEFTAALDESGGADAKSP